MNIPILVISIVIFLGALVYLAIGERISKKWKVKKGIALVIAFITLLTSLLGSDLIEIKVGDNKTANIKSKAGGENSSINNIGQDNSQINNIYGNIDENSEIIIGDSNVVIKYTYNYEKLEDESVLMAAQAYFLAEDYDKAIEKYNAPELVDNEIANINLGYMYSNGIGVEKNPDKALKYFDKADCVQGKRNAVYVCLVSNYDGRYTKELISRMQELLKEGDSVMWNYLCLCKFEKIYEEVKADSEIDLTKFTVKINELRKWHDEGLTGKLYNKPTNTDTVRYILVSMGNDSSPTSYPNYYIYRKEKLYYTELLNNYIDVL